MRINNLLQEHKCIVCKNIYYTPTDNACKRVRKSTRKKTIRMRGCRTCSPNCSREYTRNLKKYTQLRWD